MELPTEKETGDHDITYWVNHINEWAAQIDINKLLLALGYDWSIASFERGVGRAQAYLNTRRTSRRKQNRAENNYANN